MHSYINVTTRPVTPIPFFPASKDTPVLVLWLDLYCRILASRVQSSMKSQKQELNYRLGKNTWTPDGCFLQHFILHVCVCVCVFDREAATWYTVVHTHTFNIVQQAPRGSTQRQCAFIQTGLCYCDENFLLPLFHFILKD